MADSYKLLTCSENVCIWDLPTCSMLHQFNHSTAKSIVTASWDTDDQFVCIPAEEKKLVFSDIFQNDITTKEFDVGVNVTAVSCQHKSSHVAVGSATGEVLCWDRKQERIVKTIAEMTSGVTSIEYSLSDSHVAAGCVNGGISIFNTTSGISTVVLKQGDALQAVRSLHFHPSHKFLLGSSYDGGQVLLWDTKKSSLYLSLPEKHKAPAMDFKFSPLGNSVVASVGLDKRIFVHDLRLKKLVNNIRCDVPLRTLEFLPGGVSLVVGGSKGMVYVYDLRTAAAINSFVAHDKQVNKVSVSGLRSGKPKKKPDGKRRGVLSPAAHVEPKMSREHLVSTSSATSCTEDEILSPIPSQELLRSTDLRKQVLSHSAASPLSNVIQERGSTQPLPVPAISFDAAVDVDVNIFSPVLPDINSEDKENIHSPVQCKRNGGGGLTTEKEPVAMETESNSLLKSSVPNVKKSDFPNQVQLQDMRNFVTEGLQDIRSSLHTDITSMFYQMLKQFTTLQIQLQDLQEKCELNQNLVEEVFHLREENTRLRTTK